MPPIGHIAIENEIATQLGAQKSLVSHNFTIQELPMLHFSEAAKQHIKYLDSIYG